MKRIILKKENQHKTGKHITKKTYVFGLSAILLVLNVFYTLQMASLGVKMAGLEKVVNDLTKENSSLESNLIKASSLVALQDKSNQLGFVKAEANLFVKAEAVYTGYLR